MNSILVLDLWQRVDNSFAPISQKQLNFINKLDAISHNNQSNQSDSDRQTVVATDSDPLVPDFSHLYHVCIFDDWFESIETHFVNQYDSRFKKLLNYYSQCKQLLEDVNSCLTYLDQLRQQYLSVSNKTKTLHTSCEQLLQQQHGLIVAVETISQKLMYFNELQPISKKLSAPTMLVLNESLMPMLSRLDECIAYLESKKNYRESEVYLKQFQHLQSQALSTIRTHVIKTLEQTSQQVMPETKDALTPNDSVFTLFYGKFQTNAHRIKTLMQQIEERTQQSPLYSQYLSECHQCYFTARESLIGPVLSLAIDEMVASYQRNYCQLIRSSTNVVIHICQDEYQLFFQFFTQTTPLLNDFLNKNCQKLYNTLRPVVIHLEHLESLSEICYILKNEMIDENVINQSQELEPFIQSVERLLQDTQERLVYRSNIYIQSNIIDYTPCAGDLAYPEKLEMMKSIAQNLVDTKADETRSPADLHGMWYPTVRRTLVCLTKLYRSLDKSTFQGLSQEVLAACIESLDLAHNQITRRKGAPQVTEKVVDSQKAVDNKIKIKCEEFISHSTQLLISSLINLIELSKVLQKDNQLRSHQMFSSTENVKKAIAEVMDQLRANLAFVESRMALYLANRDTEIILFRPIKVKIQQNLSDLEKLIEKHYSETERQEIFLQKDNQLRSHQMFSSTENVKKAIAEVMDQLRANLAFVESRMALYLANRDTEIILFRPIKV
ncbi:unnamed protein product [Medioppia subpectinata]|uniref:Conserved oligomeric Golgi complex subunit 3 n=1 Tax=Medioppia subpectinata TaxID=1979941 RepID=A0A7R9KJQ3_9ACAR|nr:unnamed protein product [Medioppia subpectinata]CAG2103433.1 unnamed protein product [Medioppia subpectinata]